MLSAIRMTEVSVDCHTRDVARKILINVYSDRVGALQSSLQYENYMMDL